MPPWFGSKPGGGYYIYVICLMRDLRNGHGMGGAPPAQPAPLTSRPYRAMTMTRMRATLPDRPGTGDATQPADEAVPVADYRLADSVGHLLRRAHQRHTALFQERIGTAGLTPAQFAALLRLSELGRAGQNALGRAAALDSATIKGVVHRLAVRGLVTAAKDPMDRRALVLLPTPKGLELLRGAVDCARSTNAALLSPLNEAEQAQLLDLLRRVAGGGDPPAAAGPAEPEAADPLP